MTRKRKPILTPVCPYCGNAAVLLTGADVYERCRPALVDKFIWCCLPCDARVGCEGKTKKSLGTLADKQLRAARITLHNERLDRIWDRAETCGEYTPEDSKAIAIIRNTARVRTYEFLAWKLGIDRTECHTAMFDIETCRRAWTALSGVTYPEIRLWAKARKRKEAA